MQFIKEGRLIVHRFFSYCPDCGLDTHETAKEAEESADGHLEHFRDDAPDGWSEEVTAICWGEIKGEVEETERRPYNPEIDHGIDPNCECVVDYGIVPLSEPTQA